ncbi:MAG: hypothetical protein ACD_78C00318G0002 [uncultured bacterium (gcode 4)]|uniref:Uncharacterized protein n=1 Tax=uncultured bacterium (gcode 4) TaxID=1234023 RepID=K1XWV3_9BACT|nr:MAG: hypothetical protein ACD_78C00318G0002 [uncultured bacterium (gcode 4)]HBB26989.1 hypothetical protein [Candidatus Gracilibacteria bacterium]
MTNNKTEVLGPHYLIEHPKEWAEKTGFALKMNAILLATLTASFGVLFLEGILFSINVQYTVHLLETWILFTAIITVLHSFISHAFDEKARLLASCIVVLLFTFITLGSLSYLGNPQFSGELPERLLLIGKVAFVNWMINYIFVLPLRKMDG